MAPAHNIVNVTSASDGDPSSWPPVPGEYVTADPAQYLSKLAQKYMMDTGQAQPGAKYVLDQLPSGYALFGKFRHNDPKHMDRYLCGNPKYKFRSCEEFYEHFKNLMQHGNAQQCACRACMGQRTRPRQSDGMRLPKRAARKLGNLLSDIVSSTEGPLPQLQEQRKVLDNTPRFVDEEGTPDLVSRLLERLKRDNNHRTFDAPLNQLDSFDWLINRHLVKDFTKAIASQPRYLPRKGEVVLFHRQLQPGEFIALNPKSDQFERFDIPSEMFVQDFDWEAGVVTETPEIDIKLGDLTAPTHDQGLNGSYTGFRIEPMPEIGAEDKPWSKRCCYVPLHHIRPFFLFKDLLVTQSPNQYHPTVRHTLNALSSFSLFNPYHFRAKWPSATVFNRGIFLGAELLMVGDVARVFSDGDEIEDVVKITAIKTKFVRLDGDEQFIVEGEETPLEHHETCIHVSGVGYTRDPKKAADSKVVKPGLGIDEYGPWYHLHEPGKKWEVPFTKVLGRCYETQAMLRWLHGPERKTPLSTAALSLGYKAVRDARRATTDPRIAEGKLWFWADSWVEQLDLHQVNDLIVAGPDDGTPYRDSAAWMRAIKVRARATPVKPAAKAAAQEAEQADGSDLVAQQDPVDLTEEQVEENESEEVNATEQIPEPVPAHKRVTDLSQFAEMANGSDSDSE